MLSSPFSSERLEREEQSVFQTKNSTQTSNAVLLITYGCLYNFLSIKCCYMYVWQIIRY